MHNMQPNLPIGTVVQGRYVVERLLGKGGFGAVYLVRDLRVGQNLFALKEVIYSSGQELDRFTKEGELLRRLDHPALPRVYRMFTDSTNSRAYILMDYIAGTELRVLQQQRPQGRFLLSEALHIMAPIINAIAYLHDQHPPIVHRDIKPANIIVPSDGSESVLVDLGIAKEYHPDATVTSIPHLTPGYAAPEQYMGGTTTRTDIYELGVTFYSLLTGVLPANAQSRLMQLGSVGTDPLEPISQLVPSIPMPVAQAIQRAMSLRSDDRFPTVMEFWQAMTADVDGQPTLISSPTSSPASVVSPQLLSQTADKIPSQPSPAPLVLQSASPLSSIDPTKAMNDATSVPLQKRSQTPRFVWIGLLLLVLLVVLGSGIGAWSYFVNSHAPAAVSTMVPSAGPSVTQTVTIVMYPNIAGIHNGTANNVAYGSATISILFRQRGGVIGGYLTVNPPLRGSGPFTGRITTNNHIRFTVHSTEVSTPLFFQGIVRSDGSMQGTYCNLDPRNQCSSSTGSRGSWNVGPATT